MGFYLLENENPNATLRENSKKGYYYPRRSRDIQGIVVHTAEGGKEALGIAKYFAKTIFKSEIGRVNNNSIVPVLRSSAIDRMVIAGIKIRKMIGDELKNGIKSASVPSSRLDGVEATQCIIPEAIK